MQVVRAQEGERGEPFPVLFRVWVGDGEGEGAIGEGGGEGDDACVPVRWAADDGAGCGVLSRYKLICGALSS